MEFLMLLNFHTLCTSLVILNAIPPKKKNRSPKEVLRTDGRTIDMRAALKFGVN